MVGFVMAMKDMFGTEIKVGDDVVFAKSFGDREFERATVCEVNDNGVKMLFLGKGSSHWSVKKNGDKGTTKVPDRKIIICSSRSGEEADVYTSNYRIFEKELKKVKSRLDNSIKREDKLKEENKVLTAAVEKINNRFDILDL